MKLFECKSKLGEVVEFVYEDSYFDVKDHVKRDLSHWDFDLRTLKSKPFPKGKFEASDLDDWHGIFYDGKPIVRWNDSANADYPEDLTWNRDISLLIEQVEKLKELEFADRLKGLLNET